jgi:hypothetical protein
VVGWWCAPSACVSGVEGGHVGVSRIWGKGGEETPHALAFRGGCTVRVLYILYILVSTDNRFLFLDNLSFVCIKNYPYEQNGCMSTV